MSEPVSWLVVERGWRVVGADGEELGTVEALLGDAEVDIFNGLTVAHGVRGRARYVPAERVRGIFDGRVELSLDRDAFDLLEPYEGGARGVHVLPPERRR